MPSGVVIQRPANVRFGSKADICAAIGNVRFAFDSDRESGFPQKVVSALPVKADMCGALAHVRFGPKADIGRLSRIILMPLPELGGAVSHKQ
jgi:hypothetical protein